MDYEQSDEYKRIKLSTELGKVQEWSKWTNEIPFINFPADWEVKVIPPYSGAIVRFLIGDYSGNHVSVYLDCYDQLGCYGSPYWEVYPVDGDTGRCAMNDTDELIKLIKQSLEAT